MPILHQTLLLEHREHAGQFGEPMPRVAVLGLPANYLYALQDVNDVVDPSPLNSEDRSSLIQADLRALALAV
jgi:hypothetical protein